MDMPPPGLKPFATLSVLVGRPVEVGHTGQGLRRLIPITGGHASGDGWTARVLPGGTDFQLVVSATTAELDARYVLETDGGDLLYIRNRGLRVATPDVTARLVRGEAVDPALVYFRCVPTLETAAPAFAWVRDRLFVGTGVRHPAQVDLHLFELL